MKMNDKELPLVSIMTPCYNGARYIQGCIESVLAQDYPYLEHIVQDGGSDDGTVDILKRYDGSIDWVSEPDNGQPDGLNRALQRCNGDIILVLNADDELLPGAVIWGIEHMARHPEAAVIYGDQYIIDEKGEIKDAEIGPDPYDYHKLICVEQVPPAQAAFIRRSYFEQVGFNADTTLTTCPDYEMWVRIGLRFPMVHVAGFITRYRWHQQSDSRPREEIIEMHDSKRTVMDRLFNDPQTPSEISNLRRRAHAGAMSWTASVLYAEDGKLHGLFWAVRAFFKYPGMRQGRSLSLFMIRMFFPPLYRWIHRKRLEGRQIELA